MGPFKPRKGLSVDDMMRSLNREMRPTNWKAITLGLFFASLLVEAAMWQFDVVKPGVKTVFAFVIFTLAVCVFSFQREKTQVKQPKIYPFVPPTLGKDDRCPICNSFTKVGEKGQSGYGLTHPAVACTDTNCKVAEPHLHMRCETCRSGFPIYPYDKRNIEPSNKKKAGRKF